MNFKDVGVISLNHNLREECQGCLWQEWDSQTQRCANSNSPICSLYRWQLLFNTLYSAPSRSLI